MRRIHLLSISLLLMTSCSVYLDAQYGLRVASRPIKSTNFADTDTLSPAPAHNAAPYAAQFDCVEPFDFAESEDCNEAVAIEASQLEITEFDHADHETSVVDWAQSEGFTRAIVAEPVVEPIWSRKPSITTAWILWAIPAVLILVQGFGLFLMFGAHWYYLGKYRRARMATYLWALTVAMGIVFQFFRSVGLKSAAGLIGFVGLAPLILLVLIRLVLDALLLQKMTTKTARRRTPRRTQV